MLRMNNLRHSFDQLFIFKVLSLVLSSKTKDDFISF